MDLLPRPNSLCSTAFACSPGAGLALAATMMLGPGCAEPPVHDRPSPTGRIGQLAADLQQDNPWPKIREERIRLLLPQAMEAAGVDTVKELRTRNVENLTAKMKEVNDLKKLTRATPSVKVVTKWVEQASRLEPVISH